MIPVHQKQNKIGQRVLLSFEYIVNHDTKPPEKAISDQICEAFIVEWSGQGMFVKIRTPERRGFLDGNVSGWYLATALHVRCILPKKRKTR